MSQTFTDDCYGSGHVAAVDLQAFEDNFAALKSMFSGASAPSNQVAGMMWFDTAKKLPKVRNNTNSAWLGVMAADNLHKIWVYRNTAPDGWAVDSSVADVVCALKGGAQGYNVNGGVTAGTWIQPDHTLLEAEIPGHTHAVTGGSHAHNITGYIPGEGGSTVGLQVTNAGDATSTQASETATHTHTTASTGGSTAHSHGSTYRPFAAVGTLQYLDT